MGYSAKVGSFNIDVAKTAGQTQAVTGVGFQPKIVFFWWGGSVSTDDSVAAGNVNLGFSAAISSTSRGQINYISEDAQASSDSLFVQSTSAVATLYTDTGTVDGILDFTSMDADGFTFTIDDQFTQTYRISYLALGGDDLTNVYIGSGAAPTSAQSKDFTDAGFQPDALIIFANGGTSVDGSGANGYFSLGFATGASNQGVVTAFSRSAQATMETAGYGYNGEVVIRHGTGDTLNTRAAFTAFLVNGFTLNYLETSSARTFLYACLKGGQYSVGDVVTRTDGNDIAEVVGFTPIALLFASANKALSTQDTPTANARASVGAATSTSNRACAAASDEDNIADSETAFANYDSAVYAYVADDATAGLMDIKSIDASGFTCVMDDTDPSACWVTYLAIGAVAATTFMPRKNDPILQAVNRAAYW